MRQVHMIIEGRVQGVFFRSSAKEKADVLGLKGWVRNLNSGKVEIIAQGETTQLENFIEWCSQGPMRARVSKVTPEYEEIKEEYKEFKII